MGKKKRSCTCHECEVVFDVVIKTTDKTNLLPDLCPFCGDSVDLITEERPFLKDFDQYDEFDDDKYYREDDDEIEDD